MRVFIITPFGVKGEVDGAKGRIDFDAVYSQLIRPALERLNASAGSATQATRGSIAEDGELRGDLLRQMLVADLVVVDVTLHDANVFYELGVRHALRDRGTLLICAEGARRAFDLAADRYVAYDAQNPALSVPKLRGAVQQLLGADAPDSPIYAALPRLEPHPASDFVAVPREFSEEVERATSRRLVGDLEMLADDASALDWGAEGLRAVGRALLKLNARESARVVWEGLCERDLFDVEAQEALADIYRRLGELALSDMSIERALHTGGTSPEVRAKLLSLRGANARERWLADWAEAPEEGRRRRALESGWLKAALEAYARAFAADLNHFYSGLNALSLLTVRAQLAEALPEVWDGLYEEDAPRRLEQDRERAGKVAAAVELSIEAALSRLSQQDQKDIWVEISRADLLCLTSDKPARVARAYRSALGGAQALPFIAESVSNQLGIYEQLGVAAENVRAARAELPGPDLRTPSYTYRPRARQAAPRARVVLFTGHMIDKPERERPRFPQAMEPRARQAIGEALAREVEASGVSHGIAGGASGGDILFHEVCAELNVPSSLYLVMPPDDYEEASVAPAGETWVERFRLLYNRLSKESRARVLLEDKRLPRWLEARKDYGVWQRSNLWMLHNALAEGGEHVTLIALWDGEAGDGPGGTADMVDKARGRGAKVVILPTRELFGL